MALLILALLQRIFLMSSLMLLLVWLIFFMVLIKLLSILGTISGKTVKLMVFALICLGNNRHFFFQAEDVIRCWSVTGVQTCALPICRDLRPGARPRRRSRRRGRRSAGGGCCRAGVGEIGRASCRERVEKLVVVALFNKGNKRQE